jgi:hypothetical protein
MILNKNNIWFNLEINSSLASMRATSPTELISTTSRTPNDLRIVEIRRNTSDVDKDTNEEIDAKDCGDTATTTTDLRLLLNLFHMFQ